MFVIDFIAIGIGLIGAAIIIWGVLKTAVEFIVFEARSLLKDATCRQRESIRIKLGSYLLIGLEFLIAGRWEPYGFLGEAPFVGSLLFSGSRCEILN